MESKFPKIWSYLARSTTFYEIPENVVPVLTEKPPEIQTIIILLVENANSLC